MSDEPKPSARAMAAAQMLAERNLLGVHAHRIHGTLGVYPIPEVAAIIDQHLPGYEGWLALIKELHATLRESNCTTERCQRILHKCDAALALAEPEQKENE